MFAQPPPARSPLDGLTAGGPSLTRMGSNDSFVCNVSDDEVPERDIDLEIEARIRSETIVDPAAAALEYQQMQWLQRDRAMSTRALLRTGPSTLSQRMLSKLQKNKQHAAAQDTRSKRLGSTALEVVHADRVLDDNHTNGSGSNHSMGADYDGLVVADPLYDPSLDPVYMSSDDEAPNNVSHSVTSSVGRLEARISERRLQNKSSLSARPDSVSGPAVDGNELSVMYTNRRTYPAETAKKVDARFSVDGRAANQQNETTTTNTTDAAARQRLSQDQRSALAGLPVPRRSYLPDPTVDNHLDANKSLPVAFHFQGNNNQPSRDVPPTAYRGLPSTAYTAQREPPRRDDPYTTLALSVNQIEQVVKGLESCMSAGSFASLASVAIRELELLRASTKQVRTNGTTLILAEIGRPQSQMLGPLRQLVARAANVQSRIENLIVHVKGVL